MEKGDTATNKTAEFFAAAKRFPWIIDIYLALQSCMALGIKNVDDFNVLCDKIMPRPDRTPDCFIPLGNKGLELLGILYKCDRVATGSTDYHEYRFTRLSDGATVTGTIKI